MYFQFQLVPLFLFVWVSTSQCSDASNTGIRDFSTHTPRYSWCADDNKGTISNCVDSCSAQGCLKTRYPPGTWNLDCRACFCKCEWETKRTLDGKEVRKTVEGYCPLKALIANSGDGSTKNCKLDWGAEFRITYPTFGDARCNYWEAKPDPIGKVESDCKNYWNGLSF